MVGFGMGNYRDDLMEKLADKGNGNAFYVDGIREARRVFQTRLTGTLEVIAKDVKIQVEFDPKVVRSYRLLGYENRDIADQDFRNDKVDAGEVGAGHSVTALYEVQLAGAGDLGTVRVRAKEPSGTVAKEAAFPMLRAFVHESLAAATPDFRFATAVAGTADILRHSVQSETWSLALAEQLARDSAGGDPEREEFVRLVGRARALFASTYPVTGR
jgi:Ca-activated chloride channel family protein